MNEKEFHGVDLDWMKAQWRDCKDKDEQLIIFRDMTGATEREIIGVLEPGYCPERKPFNSNTKWTEEEDARLLSMRKAGKTCKEIAAELKRSMAAVQSRYILIKNHDAEDGEPGIITAEVDTDVVSLEDAEEAIAMNLRPFTPDSPYEEIRNRIEALKRSEAVLEEELRTVREELEETRGALSELLALAGGGLT